MSMRLYTNQLSNHGRRVSMALIEMGLDSEVKSLDFAKGEHKAPDYMQHNPNGKVPCLEDNGFWLWESNAIIQYLADKKGDKNLYPSDPQARANVNRWLFWDSAHFGAACSRLVGERVLKPMRGGSPDPVLDADGVENFARFGAVLNGQLEGKQFITGNTMTIADLAIATSLTYHQAAKFDMAPYKHVTSWLERMSSRDSWKKTQPQF